MIAVLGDRDSMLKHLIERRRGPIAMARQRLSVDRKRPLLTFYREEHAYLPVSGHFLLKRYKPNDVDVPLIFLTALLLFSLQQVVAHLGSGTFRPLDFVEGRLRLEAWLPRLFRFFRHVIPCRFLARSIISRHRSSLPQIPRDAGLRRSN